MGASPWGELARVSRAVRVGDTIHVSGTVSPGDTVADQVGKQRAAAATTTTTTTTTATTALSNVAPASQVKGCFVVIEDAIKEAGGKGLEDGKVASLPPPSQPQLS